MESSRQSVDYIKIVLDDPLVSRINDVLDKTAFKLKEESKLKPISASFITSSRSKVTVDLNVCRPVKSSAVRRSDNPDDFEQINLEDPIIIWLDQTLNQQEIKERECNSRLQEVVNCFKIFNNPIECLNYICSITEQKLFLIISGSFGNAFINEMHSFSHVLSIYVYYLGKQQPNRWLKNYRKIAGTFTDENTLFQQIIHDVATFFRTYLPMSISVIRPIDTTKQTTQDLMKQQAKLMWSQILINALFNLPQTTRAKDTLIQECRRQYKNSNSQQKMIDKFEKTYNSSNAMQWYTPTCFLYRTLNQSLHTQNIFYILKCRFFIVDLYQNLKILHSKFIRSLPNSILTVYRGQRMTAAEFSKLQVNVNGYVSINTFLTATYSSKIAANFAGDGSERAIYESIVFEMKIDLNLHKMPLTDIRHLDQFQSEEELLLSPGTIFRIDSIELINDTVWSIKLTSTDEMNTENNAHLPEYLKKCLSNKTSYLAFGNILQDMGQYDQAEKFYELLLTDLPANHHDLAAIYASLGIAISKTRKDFQRALYYLRHSLILQMKIFPDKFILFADTLGNIGNIFTERRQYKIGLKYFTLVLQMFDCVHSKDQSKIALRRSEIYKTIGDIYFQTNRFSLALKYYRMSQQIENEVLPPDHPSIATGLSNIALVYLKKRNFQSANKYFEQSMAIREISLPFEYYPRMLEMYDNLGMKEYEQKHFDEAIIHFAKALKVQLKYLPTVHTQTVLLYNNLGNTYVAQNDFKKALEMYENALEIGEQCWSSNHPEIGQIYGNIGSVCRILKYYTRALACCEKALEIAKKSLPLVHIDLAEAYRNVAELHSDNDNPKLALANFLKALDIYTKISDVDQFRLGVLYEQIGTEYYKNKSYNEAIQNFQNAVRIFRSSNQDESTLIELYYNLSRAFYENEDYNNAIFYIEKRLQNQLRSMANVNYRSLSRTYDTLGDIHRQKKDYRNSLINYERALESLRKDISMPSATNDYATLLREYENNIEEVKSLLK